MIRKIAATLLVAVLLALTSTPTAQAGSYASQAEQNLNYANQYSLVLYQDNYSDTDAGNAAYASAVAAYLVNQGDEADALTWAMDAYNSAVSAYNANTTDPNAYPAMYFAYAGYYYTYLDYYYGTSLGDQMIYDFYSAWSAGTYGVAFYLHNAEQYNYTSEWGWASGLQALETYSDLQYFQGYAAQAYNYAYISVYYADLAYNGGSTYSSEYLTTQAALNADYAAAYAYWAYVFGD